LLLRPPARRVADVALVEGIREDVVNVLSDDFRVTAGDMAEQELQATPIIKLHAHL
jgi:hypothetical protein